MRSHLNKLALVLLAGALTLTGRLLAQQLSCDQVPAIAKMADAQSSKALEQLKSSAGNDYRAELVFTFRQFEVKPTSETATAVLDFPAFGTKPS